MQLPIVDMSGTPHDWSTPQAGMYRCEGGWESGDAQYRCLNQAVVKSKDGGLYCHPCAVVFALGDNTAAIREETESAVERAAQANQLTADVVTALEDIQFSLADIAWCSQPWWFRCMGRIHSILRRRKGTTETNP